MENTSYRVSLEEAKCLQLNKQFYKAMTNIENHWMGNFTATVTKFYRQINYTFHIYKIENPILKIC